MRLETFLDVLCAAHLSTYIGADVSADRGGIMLVGAPGTFKSRMLTSLERLYPDVLVLSDVNVQTLVGLKESIVSGGVRTLILPELQKVYERHQNTAGNVEGTLRALVAEGFKGASFQDQRIHRLDARCLVLAGMTPALVERRFAYWDESGFSRRFLWLLLQLSNPEMLDRCVEYWTPLVVEKVSWPRPPVTGTVRVEEWTTPEERRTFRGAVRYQYGGSHVLQSALLARICTILRWWYSEHPNGTDAWVVMQELMGGLGKDGLSLQLPTVRRPSSRRKRTPASRKKRR